MADQIRHQNWSSSQNVCKIVSIFMGLDPDKFPDRVAYDILEFRLFQFSGKFSYWIQEKPSHIALDEASMTRRKSC